MTTLSGTVPLDDSTTAKGAVVELHNSAGDVIDQVQVDDEGKYKYHLAVGTWKLRLWDARGHRGASEVTLEDGEDKTLDITLKSEGGA